MNKTTLASAAPCILAAAFLLLLTACSNANSNSPAPAAPAGSAAVASAGPCSLLTQSEVEAALGKGATMTPTPNPRTGMDECRLKPGQVSGIDTIIVVVHSATGWETAKKALMEKPAPGLGDDAFAGRFIGYNVRKGSKYVQVFGSMTNEAAANDKATRYLAERASTRL